VKIPRIYTGPDGRSHWDDDFEVELAPGDGGDWVSALQAASGVSFRRAPAGHVIDWHPAPRRQYVVTLTGEVEYEIGDGMRRRFGPGSVFLADDLTGEGHVARGVGGADRTSLYIPLER
jgi:hypothetical protein